MTVMELTAVRPYGRLNPEIEDLVRFRECGEPQEDYGAVASELALVPLRDLCGRLGFGHVLTRSGILVEL